jgi:hypothetical protein
LNALNVSKDKGAKSLEEGANWQVRVRYTQTRTWLVRALSEKDAREAALYWAERFFRPQKHDKLKVVSIEIQLCDKNY